MRYHLAEAIRINGLAANRRRSEIAQLPLGTRTLIAVLAKHLQGRKHMSIAAMHAHRRGRGE